MYDRMLAGEHLTVKGLESLVALTVHMPKGMSPELQEAFPHLKSLSPWVKWISPTHRLNPDWIAGFVSSDGCFNLALREKANSKSDIGYYVSALFRVTQHTRSVLTLERIQEVLGGS